jgi:thiol-disulfide isomerase/thioredoxin
MLRALAALTFAIYVFGITVPANASDATARVWAKAPAFLLETPSGRDVTLASFTGRPLVLNVFASWCPPCRLELPRIVSAAHATPSIAFFGVDEQEATEMATSFASRMRLPYPIAIDHGQFAASYGAQSLPETIFVDAHGTIRAIVHGAIAQSELDRDLALISHASGGST